MYTTSTLLSQRTTLYFHHIPVTLATASPLHFHNIYITYPPHHHYILTTFTLLGHHIIITFQTNSLTWPSHQQYIFATLTLPIYQIIVTCLPHSHYSSTKPPTHFHQSPHYLASTPPLHFYHIHITQSLHMYTTITIHQIHNGEPPHQQDIFTALHCLATITPLHFYRFTLVSYILRYSTITLATCLCFQRTASKCKHSAPRK